MGTVISGFAGIGKTHYVGENPKKAIDLESSNYKWVYHNADDVNLGEARKGIVEKDLNPEWPKNYIEAIKGNLDKYDYVFICQDFDVRNMLKAEGVEYYVAFPNIRDKQCYLDRYKRRGNAENFINLFDAKYEDFVADLMLKEKNQIRLHRYEYLSDALKRFEKNK